MNGKTKLIILGKAKGAMDKLKQVLTKKWFIALILAMTVCCGTAAMLYLPSIGLSYNQLMLGVKFSGFVAAAKIVAILGICFLVICLAALAIGGLVAFGCSILFRGYKPSPETVFKTAAQSATMIVLVLFLTMSRYTSLTEEISESYAFSKNQLVEKMLVAHKKDLRCSKKSEVKLEVPSIGMYNGTKKMAKKLRDKVVLVYVKKGEYNFENGRGTINQVVVRKSNFSYKKSEDHTRQKEYLGWKNKKYKKAFSKYLDRSTSYEVFDPENDKYWVTAPTGFGTDLFIKKDQLFNEDSNEQSKNL